MRLTVQENKIQNKRTFLEFAKNFSLANVWNPFALSSNSLSFIN